jgi:hypothetical protein
MIAAANALPWHNAGTFFARVGQTVESPSSPMTFKLWILSGGLLAFAAAGTALGMVRARSKRFTTDQLSRDWLAQARAREEHPW